MTALRSVCVFCGSRSGTDPDHVAAARAFGQSIADQGWRLVYGAGDVGLMGGTWDLAETAIQRLDLDQPLSAKALATDGVRVWLLVTRRGDVMVVELTSEGAPICLD